MTILFVPMLMLQADPVYVANCTQPRTQMEMNMCSHQEYQAADAALNSAWTVAVREALESDRISPPSDRSQGAYRQLLTAQRAWIAYRDSHCLAVADQYRGGSIRPLIHNTCMSELTKTRTVQLRELSETN
jgi:uncharacterized protein YecT (DUF1311 family)